MRKFTSLSASFLRPTATRTQLGIPVLGLNRREQETAKPSTSLLGRVEQESARPSATALSLTSLWPATLLCGGAVVAQEVEAIVAAPLVGPAMVTFLQWAPAIACQGMFLSGYKVCKQIQQDGTTGQFSSLPFVSMYTNCTVWTLFGILNADMTVALANGAGLVQGLYYTSIYHRYTTASLTKDYIFTGTICVGALGCAIMLPTATASSVLGIGGSVAAVVLMSSPLAVIKTVLKNKDTSAMPFLTTIATFGNASLWTSYGALVVHVPVIWVPNGLGLLAACVQLSLFARFGISSPSNSKKR